MHAVGLVLALSVVWAATASAGETFKNPTAGFEVTKPKGWHYVTTEQMQEDLKRVKLEDKDFQEALQKYATVPMVAMDKYEEPYNDVNPSFKVNLRPMGQLKGRSAVEILNMFLPQLQRTLKDASVVQQPMKSVVSGLEGAYTRMDYSLETSDGQTFPSASELWIIPRGDYFFLFGAATRQDEKNGTRKEIQAILKTVKIKH